MASFVRLANPVDVWQIPLWGCIADETLPMWLLDRLASGEIMINDLGGFTRSTAFGADGCAAGDYVVYDMVLGDIEFCPQTRFISQFLRPAQAA